MLVTFYINVIFIFLHYLHIRDDTWNSYQWNEKKRIYWA